MIKGSKKINGKIKDLHIRLTDDEYNLIACKAKLHKMNKTEYIIYLVNQDDNSK